MLTILTSALGGCAPKHYSVSTPDTVTFYLQIPETNNIKFSFSMDNFQIHDTAINGDGYWYITVPSGYSFQYFYLVDGLVYVPECRFKEADDFGSENCIYLPEDVTSDILERL